MSDVSNVLAYKFDALSLAFPAESFEADIYFIAFEIAGLSDELLSHACDLALVKCTKFPCPSELVDLARTVAAVFQILNKPTDG